MSEETNKIKELLNSVSAISKKYEEMARLSGENFNIFNILGLSTREVRTHSAFIAELLNPKGSHGQGSVFLKLFVEQHNIERFNTETATTKVEKHIGLITEDKTEGGNIDIISVDIENNGIIIENKIYAEDRENQLLRYYNYGDKSLGEFELYYLTLDGKEPTDWSLGKLEKDKYRLISYEADIKNWLERCKEKAVSQPILRETITQYIYLIKQLTGQAMSDKMSDDIKGFFNTNPEYVDIVLENRVQDIARSYKEELEDDIIKTLNEKLIIENRIYKFEKIKFITEFIVDDDGFIICLKGYNDDNSWLNLSSSEPNINIDKLRSLIKDMGYQINGSYLCWKKLNDFNNIKRLFDLNMSQLQSYLKDDNKAILLKEAFDFFEDVKKLISKLGM